MAPTRQTVSLLQRAATLKCPAAAAERTPKRPQIADRQPGRPRSSMIVGMDTAMVSAAAGRGKRPQYCSLRIAAFRPSRIAAEAPNRRPVRYGGRWCRLVESGEVAGSVDHLAPDNRQRSRDIGDLILGARKVVAVRDD